MTELPIIGFAAWSGTGKTTLLTALFPLLHAEGVRIAAIKRTHHNVEFDTPGKDSHRLRTAGASQMLVTSGKRWALYGEETHVQEPDLNKEIAKLNTDTIDIVIVESFKKAAIPKIELHRPSLEKPLLYPEDPHIIAVASDEALPLSAHLTALDINAVEQIAQFIINTFLTGKVSS